MSSKASTRSTSATPKKTVKKSASSSSSSSTTKKATRKVTRHVDAKVAARNTALNAMGGVKVDVFVRVRPANPSLEKDDPVIVDVDPDNSQIKLQDPAGNEAAYTYDKVYGPESTQEELYTDCVSPIVEQVCRGMACCIFAYGQTGAGKTYTMRGDLSGNPEKHGIIQRSLVHLFERLHEHDYTDIKVKASFLEIYNEELEDLFVDPPKATKQKKPTTARRPTSSKSTQSNTRLMLVDDQQRGCVCSGLKEVEVDNLEQVMELLNEAEQRCRFSETKMNKLSNRAHRIFTLTVNFKRWETPVTTTLTFVDLAGSEDISRSGATGLTAREASHINKSLLTLGRVINALACNEKHIPYRDSKLTRLLSEALGGVCKTSFIACVSPCKGSNTESNSTLRYAERAMEALNISQLPRWKQDEIMIDGLTRRVQQLVDDMENMQKIHHEEMVELRNERDELVEENTNLLRQVGRANRKIDRLNKRKTVLKSGLSVMTSFRDQLHSQKEALRAELLETRSVRDGFLSDREILTDVLKAVRETRNRLLQAHAATEQSLLRDANSLKGVLEGAIDDVEELHTEVARKKSLSLHNEKEADSFRDDMSGRIRHMVQSITDFQQDQDEKYSGLDGVLADMRSTRQRETGALRSDVAKVASSIGAVFADLTQKLQEHEATRKSKIARATDVAETQLSDLTVQLDRAKASVVEQVTGLRKQAGALDETLDTWLDKLRAKLDETIESSRIFTSESVGRIAALAKHVEDASQSQLDDLKEHMNSMESNFEREKATLTQDNNKLIEDISAYVTRLLTEHNTKTIRRAQKATSEFVTAATAISNDVGELKSHLGSAFDATISDINAQHTAQEALLNDGKQLHASQQQAAKSLLSSVVDAADATEQTLEDGTKTTSTLAQQHHQVKLQALKEDTAFAEKTTKSLDKVITKGNKEAQKDTEAIREKLSAHHDTFVQAADDMDQRLQDTQEGMRQQVETANDDLMDADATTYEYVEQKIKRDTKDPPTRKKYKYPTDYANTMPYEEILSDFAQEWQREAKIRDGAAVPGKGIDYPGEKGPEDGSGIYTTTADAPPPKDAQVTVEDASRQSEPGEYSDPEGFIDPIDRDSDQEEEGSVDAHPGTPVQDDPVSQDENVPVRNGGVPASGDTGEPDALDASEDGYA